MPITKLPFTITKRKDSSFYSVRFKNEKTGKYLPALSTKQKDKDAAIKTAWLWYSQGKVHSAQKEQSLQSLSIFDEIRKSDISENDAEEILRLFKQKGIIQNYIKSGDKNQKGAINAFKFMLDFWDWEKSPYIKEKLRRHHSIGKPHALRQYNNIKKHWRPYLENKTLSEITKQDIWDFLERQENEDVCYQTKNDRIRSCTTALRWAYEHEYIEKDISTGYVFFSGEYNEREILTPEIVETLFSFTWDDEIAMLANVVAMCKGMRAAEIASLQYKDLGENCIYIQHSWNAKDGLKTTKNKENRIALLPFPSIINALKRLAKQNPYNQGLEGFIFFATIPNKPLETKVFLKGLRNALEKIGMSKDTASNYTFHAWRHYFSIYMKDSVNDKILQQQTGHKTIEMLEHYSAHKINTDDLKLINAQQQKFGSIVNSLPKFDFSDKQKLYENIKTGYMDKSGLYAHSRQDR